MIKRSEKVLDDREHLRIKENCNVYWHVKGKDYKGKAKICNISAGGMMMEADTEPFSQDQHDFIFQAMNKTTDFIPQSGHLVWQRKKNFPKNGVQCGIVFDDTNDAVLTNLRERIQNTIGRFTRRRKYQALINIMLAVLLVIFLIYSALITIDVYRNMNTSQETIDFSVRLQTRAMQNYQSLYRETDRKLSLADNKLELTTAELNSTRKSYQESQKLVLAVSKELEATRAILKETESMLNLAKAGTTEMQEEMQSLRNLTETEWEKTSTELRESVALLNEKNIQLSNELNIVQQKLDFYEGSVRNNNEAASLIQFYRSKMRLVKSKIKDFNKEAEQVRKTAQMEKDRIRLMLGNNGYLIRNGKEVQVDMDRYYAATLDSVQVKDSVAKDRVQIDVTFVEEF